MTKKIPLLGERGRGKIGQVVLLQKREGTVLGALPLPEKLLSPTVFAIVPLD